MFSKEIFDVVNGKMYYYNNREPPLDQKYIETLELDQICEHDFQG